MYDLRALQKTLQLTSDQALRTTHHTPHTTHHSRTPHITHHKPHTTTTCHQTRVTQMRQSVDAIWCIFDDDGNGSIDRDEFLKPNEGLADTIIATIGSGGM